MPNGGCRSRRPQVFGSDSTRKSALFHEFSRNSSRRRVRRARRDARFTLAAVRAFLHPIADGLLERLT